MKAVVTGGAGFIGHHLVRSLLSDGHEVAVIDDLSTGDITRLAPYTRQVQVVVGTILDRVSLDQVMAGAEVVFHEAALPSVARSVADPRKSNEINTSGTIEVMLAAARHGVRRVVFAGSSSVYGIPETLPCLETMRPAPESPYGTSKLAAEHYVRTLGRLHSVETVVLRYFNVFGPGQDPKSEYAAVVPRFMTAVLTGARPIVNGDGRVSRDFTYVDNVVLANRLAAEPGAPSGVTCNIACGSRHSLLELLTEICRATGLQANPVFGPPRPGDIQDSEASISLAASLIGYAPAVSFQEGIGRTAAWYQASQSA